jgi:hypothetical protein
VRSSKSFSTWDDITEEDGRDGRGEGYLVDQEHFLGSVGLESFGPHCGEESMESDLHHRLRRTTCQRETEERGIRGGVMIAREDKTLVLVGFGVAIPFEKSHQTEDQRLVI